MDCVFKVTIKPDQYLLQSIMLPRYFWEIFYKFEKHTKNVFLKEEIVLCGVEAFRQQLLPDEIQSRQRPSTYIVYISFKYLFKLTACVCKNNKISSPFLLKICQDTNLERGR